VNLRTFEVRLFGTAGMLYLDLWRGTMEFIGMNGEHQHFPDIAQEDVYPHRAPAMNLIDSILDPACNRSPASLGVAAMEVIEAACASARSGQNVLVPSLMEQKA
jgi:predicted dehydrogenase